MQTDSLTLALKAAHYAAEKHSGQRRKGTALEPYINHLIEVAMLLAEATGGKDVTLVMAGLLHDTVEDTQVTRDDLVSEFGEEIAGLVMEVTDDKSLPKEERKRLQVVNAPHKSNRAKLIKMADKISNLRAMLYSPPSDWSEQRKRDYFIWAKQVIDGCRNINATLERQFDELHQEGLVRYAG